MPVGHPSVWGGGQSQRHPQERQCSLPSELDYLYSGIGKLVRTEPLLFPKGGEPQTVTVFHELFFLVHFGIFLRRLSQWKGENVEIISPHLGMTSFEVSASNQDSNFHSRFKLSLKFALQSSPSFFCFQFQTSWFFSFDFSAFCICCFD